MNSTYSRAILAFACLLMIPASLWAQKTGRSGRTRSTPPAQTKTAPRTTPATPQQTPQSVNLSAQDLALLIEELGVPPQARAQLASNEASRKEFVQDLREMFAVADEAKAAGFTARP
ncbi:MAG TPA: hypothetical protein VGB76_05775, partial [Pyrinomonadaceae bacterium]